jgi:hypothetical protein
MVEAATDIGIFTEATVFLFYFKDLPDPRQRGNAAR